MIKLTLQLVTYYAALALAAYGAYLLIISH